MKKLIALLLTLMLLCAAGAGAESVSKVKLGTVSINGEFTLQCGLPEGYKPVPVVATRDQIIAVITSQDPQAPVMMLSIAFDETYSDVDRMNDLDSDQLAILERTFTEDDPEVQISYGETGYGTLVMIAKHDTDNLDFVSFLSIYKGYFVEFALIPSESAEDKNLTDEQMKVSIDFLTDLDFISPEDTPNNVRKDETYTAIIKGYNAETNTLEAELRTDVQIQPEYIDEALKVGEIFEIGQEEVMVDTITSYDSFDYVINGEYELEKQENGLYKVFQFYREMLMTFAETTLPVAEDAVFLDDIDPETQDILEEPMKYTMAKFAEMLSSEDTGIGPGFALDNVRITLDENGAVKQIERIFIP